LEAAGTVAAGGVAVGVVAGADATAVAAVLVEVLEAAAVVVLVVVGGGLAPLAAIVEMLVLCMGACLLGARKITSPRIFGRSLKTLRR
jgi:hypothetical protein